MHLEVSEESWLIGPWSRRDEPPMYTFWTTERGTLVWNRRIRPDWTRSLWADEWVVFLTAKIQWANVFKTVAEMYGKQ